MLSTVVCMFIDFADVAGNIQGGGGGGQCSCHHVCPECAVAE